MVADNPELFTGFIDCTERCKVAMNLSTRTCILTIALPSTALSVQNNVFSRRSIFPFGMDQELIASEMLELVISIFQDEQVWTEKQD